MDLQLKGKNALVTGGSRGIGKAIARVLALEGANVALLARNAQALAATASELSAEAHRPVIGIVGDTTNDESVHTAIADAISRLGGTIDILVNAASEPGGFEAPPGLSEISTQYFHTELNTKVMGYLRCAREVAPGMRERGWGRIVNISGLAARQTGSTVGSIRNVAVAALTKNLADELGRAGINVTVVHPGTTRVERTAALVAKRATERGMTPQEVEAEIGARNTTGRLVDAAEVADVVAFLCSPRSRAINGDAIAVGGGTPQAIHY